MRQQAQDPLRRAGNETRAPGHEPTQVFRVEPVDILVGRYREQHSVLVDVGRQRQLHEDPVDPRVGVQRRHQGEHQFLRRVSRQPMRDVVEAHLVAPLLLVPHVDRRRRVVADEHDRQAGRTRRRRDPRGEFREHGVPHRRALEDHRVSRSAQRRLLPVASPQRATADARVSRMTITLICPGYSSSFSMRRLTSSARTAASASETSVWLTRIRISRPAWMA